MGRTDRAVQWRLSETLQPNSAPLSAEQKAPQLPDRRSGRTYGLRLEGKDTMATATATDRKGPMSTEHKQEREGEGFYIMLLSVGSL